MILLDIKEASAAAAPLAPKVNMPRNPADRVLAGARAPSPILGERIVPARLMDKLVFIREVTP